MSLASIAFSRLSTKVITPLSSTIIPKLGSISSGGGSVSSSSVFSLFQPQQLLHHHHHQQQPSKIKISIRSVFSEVIRQIPSDDPQKQGALTFEDPDLADARIGRNIRGECKYNASLGDDVMLFICIFVQWAHTLYFMSFFHNISRGHHPHQQHHFEGGLDL